MEWDEPTRLLSELEQLLKVDNWEDYKKISELFNKLGELDLKGEQYNRYLFLLNRF